MNAHEHFLSLLTPSDREALERARVSRGPRKGALKRQAPSFSKDPHAWAAWAGLKTALGHHTEGVTFNLVIADQDTRDVWDRVSDAAIAVRKRLGV